MIRITVELVPFGIEAAKRVLTRAEIWNTGTGSKQTGNYEYKLADCGRRKPRVWRKGTVSGFARSRLNVWHLIKRVLEDAIK